MLEVKRCKKCNECKPATIEFFPPDKGNKDGLRGSCRECKNKYDREFRKNNPDKVHERDRKNHQSQKERRKKYYKQYSKENREHIAETQRKWRQENPDKMKILHIRKRHIKRSLPHTLTLEQWQGIIKFFGGTCAYCGKEFNDSNKPTQEHFIPVSRGGSYTKNNILPVCNSCNSSKCDRSFDWWYPKQSFYSTEREEFILNFLND